MCRIKLSDSYIYLTVRGISTFTDIITRHLTHSLLCHVHMNLSLTVAINSICIVKIQASKRVWRLSSCWTKCHLECDNKTLLQRLPSTYKYYATLYSLMNNHFNIIFILPWKWKEIFFSRRRKPGYFSFFPTRICLRSGREEIPRALTIPRDKRYGLHYQYL
jgi:hypothetical protein